jgi:hypothetical protein
VTISSNLSLMAIPWRIISAPGGLRQAFGG